MYNTIIKEFKMSDSYDDEMLLETEKRWGFKIENLECSLSDESAVVFAEELITQLRRLKHRSSTDAMNSHRLFLQGKMEMLNEVIKYIDSVT
jgi:hypothetical protein